MKVEKNPPKKKRRNPDEIDNDVFKALQSLIIEKGFENVTITEVMKNAEVEPGVIYNRYKSLDNLFDKYIRQYDYWFYDLVKSYTDADRPVQSMKNILVGLTNDLYENPVMQKILLWELSNRNTIASRTAMNRELNSKPLLSFFRQTLGDAVNFDHFTSILIGGIYYLILHKDVSTFCEIDYNNKTEKENFIKTIELLIDNMYSAKAESVAK